MDINNPSGTGNLTISKMSIESDSVSFDFEGDATDKQVGK